MTSGVVKSWLIDDEDFEFDLVGRTTERLRIPFRFRYFTRAEDACAALENLDGRERPRLIFCDLKMPGMDGFEFLNWLRASPYRCTPVIVRSNSDRPGDITRAYELGANAYQTKPLLMDGLAARLRATFDFWFSCQVPDPSWNSQVAANLTRDAARRMGQSHLKILRVLSVAFKVEELEFLQTQPEFLKQLDASAGQPQHTPENIAELCRAGGELLARYLRG